MARMKSNQKSDPPALMWASRLLRSTGRGKHMVQFSYYHVDLIAEMPDVAELLETIRRRFDAQQSEYNVVKLGQSRLSFLLYEQFSQPFPALLTALSCDIARATSRFTDYSQRRNPPILHRKELLLPADHPLVPPAAKLTTELDRLGAFKSPSQIGTRDGWLGRLSSMGLAIENGVLVSSG